MFLRGVLIIIIRVFRDREDKFTLKSLSKRHVLCPSRSFWEVCHSRGLSLGPRSFQKSKKSESYQVCSHQKELIYPLPSTAVLRYPLVRNLRPGSRLGAPSVYVASGQSSGCQVAYLSFGVCELHEILAREGKPVVAALPWLSTNIGSRHATLAAKKAWMQWSTAKRLENSSSCNRQTVPNRHLHSAKKRNVAF